MRDIKDEVDDVEVAKEVLEVPLMEYEDDSKPSKMQCKTKLLLFRIYLYL